MATHVISLVTRGAYRFAVLLRDGANSKVAGASVAQAKRDACTVAVVVIPTDRPTGPIGAPLREAALSKASRSTCSVCPIKRGCYAQHGQEASSAIPSTVSALLRRGVDLWAMPDFALYPDAIERLVAGRTVRLCSIGDPADIHPIILSAILAAAPRALGYTHAWRLAEGAALQHACMASVETERGATKAQAAGWRTFRVRAVGSAVMPGEVDCRSAEGLSCVQCGLCDGKHGPEDKRANVSIEAHGPAMRNIK